MRGLIHANHSDADERTDPPVPAILPFRREHRTTGAGDDHPLKICLASRAPFLGGAELAAMRLALGLQQRGHEVLCVLGQRGPVIQRFDDAGLRTIHIPFHHTDKRRFWRYLATRTALRNFLKRERPDILHANDLPSSQLAADAARGLAVTRICHHRFIYDGPAIDWFNKYGADRHLFVSRALMNELCGRSRGLTAASRAVAYDGLPLAPLPSRADRAEARLELGLPTDRAIVAFAGQVIERKGVSELVQAWAILHERSAAARRTLDAELLIIGDDLAGAGRYRQHVQQLAHLLNVDPRFVGFQKNVDRWLTAADIAVAPSHVEPLGNATLEAMAHGLPVIGTRIGGIPEMIAHEKTGLLVPAKAPMALADAMERLIHNAPQRRHLGVAARRRCEALFSLDAHVDAVLAEYAVARGSRTTITRRQAA